MKNNLRPALVFFLLMCCMLQPVTAATSTTKVPDNEDATLADVDQDDDVSVSIADPYQKFNRVMFTINDKLDSYILKPIATLYNKIMPKPLNRGLHNAFSNLSEFSTIGNDLLQLRFYQALNDSWRLGINSTVGLAGFFDVATEINLPYYSNDFGLTLASYGYENSNYLVLPFFGPNTVRDAVGIPVDSYAFSAYQYIYPRDTRYALYALSVVDHRAHLLQYQSVFDEAAFDQYVFLRNAYMQRRAYQIKKNAGLHMMTSDEAGSLEDSKKPVQNYDAF